MENNDSVENRKGFFQNGRAPIFGFLTISFICVIGIMVATIRGLDRRRQIISADATSRALAHDQYEFIERFSPTSTRWFVGPRINPSWEGSLKIEEGVYLWDIEKVNDTFVWWTDFYLVTGIKDFDVYVDTKVPDIASGNICSGFVFRKSMRAWNNIGYYYFVVCSDSSGFIGHYNTQNGHEEIATGSYKKGSNDWNRLEIIARDTNFTFIINGNQLYEMDDDRQMVGGLALVIALNEKVPGEIMFDNFGYQSR